MTSIEIRVRDLYDDLNDSEKKAASFFLSHVDSVFVLPIAKLAKQADTTQVAWVRLCKHIGFDGLKDMKKALFNELNETNAPTAQRESSGFFTDIRDYNQIPKCHSPMHTCHEPDDTHNHSQNRCCKTLFNLRHHQKIDRSTQQCTSHRHIKGQNRIGCEKNSSHKGEYQKEC